MTLRCNKAIPPHKPHDQCTMGEPLDSAASEQARTATSLSLNHCEGGERNLYLLSSRSKLEVVLAA
eukprot:CAMPEP_0196721702 /NCGR_PEP_ID=MMETSP1091-20130531/4193_1 /TAXON_ID=302021 /ORGANISM="Rhodomonas sp., Strain CCMP768" /LENGTH=65 /DNA_ID=CAMNT_0042063223 /DNA_START=74 /DNA_END=269 /DNA_ORIENTATION=+